MLTFLLLLSFSFLSFSLSFPVHFVGVNCGTQGRFYVEVVYLDDIALSPSPLFRTEEGGFTSCSSLLSYQGGI